MTTIKVAGVPEHFNLPWHLAIENGAFTQEDIDLQWQDYPGGTGAMCKALRENEIDVAIILTEGILADIVKGNPSKIIQTYVDSPLTWGIHTGVDSKYTDASELEGAKYAISRYLSGSHLMAIVDQNNRGFDTEKIKFEVIGNLQGALKAFEKNDVDAFMWEKFTTKPYCDNGQLRRIGECPTPWPCFVIAVRDEFLSTHQEDISRMLKVINSSSQTLKQDPNAIEMISKRYNLQANDVKTWFDATEWSNGEAIDQEMITHTLETLKSLGIIDKISNPTEFIG